MMTHFLASDENPDGAKLEDILTTIRNDVFHRSNKIADDKNPVAERVTDNNIKILTHLSEAIKLAKNSTEALDKAFGPGGGKPRIGTE